MAINKIPYQSPSFTRLPGNFRSPITPLDVSSLKNTKALWDTVFKMGDGAYLKFSKDISKILGSDLKNEVSKGMIDGLKKSLGPMGKIFGGTFIAGAIAHGIAGIADQYFAENRAQGLEKYGRYSQGEQTRLQAGTLGGNLLRIVPLIGGPIADLVESGWKAGRQQQIQMLQMLETRREGGRGAINSMTNIRNASNIDTNERLSASEKDYNKTLIPILDAQRQARNNLIVQKDIDRQLSELQNSKTAGFGPNFPDYIKKVEDLKKQKLALGDPNRIIEDGNKTMALLKANYSKKMMNEIYGNGKVAIGSSQYSVGLNTQNSPMSPRRMTTEGQIETTEMTALLREIAENTKHNGVQ
jgi:hypothetical protein